MADPLLPHMVQDYFLAQLRPIMARRDETLAQLRTRDQALRYRALVRRKLSAIFGPWPTRTPLKARVTGVVERPRYRIERVLFQSRPDYYVTACLYVPRGKGPFPGVLATCGHSDDGKALPTYQLFVRSLAEQGYLVLHYDPVSQGERDQFAHLPKRQYVRGCVRQHNMIGHKLGLLGQFLGSWRTWDGLRALDYLWSRPELDRRHVGLTGNSGGGTMTTYLSPFDDRFTMAAPGCFVTTYLHDLENELPADSEQIPPGIHAAGLDIGDFYIAAAPRPVIFLGQEHDYFDRRGLRKTYEQVKRFYGLLGATDRVALHIGPGIHGYQKDARLAMYRFFNQIAGVKASGKESPRPVELPGVINAAAPGGQVKNLRDNRFVHDLASDLADALRRRRKRHTPDSLRTALTHTLNLPRRVGAPHYRVMRPLPPIRRGPYRACTLYAVQTEPDYPELRAVLHLWEKTRPLGRGHPLPMEEATLYLPHTDSQEDVRGGLSPVEPRWLYSLDVRGLGRCMQRTCGDTEFFTSYGADFFYACHGLMLGQSYFGRRVHDVLATLDLLGSLGTQRVHLVGRGLGSVLATVAGCLHRLVHRVTLKHTLGSFDLIAHTATYAWPLSSLPFGALRNWDLPDCHRALRAKQLRIIEPWDAMMKPLKR